jgi:hypothetical protein
VVDDITVEKLAVVLQENPGGVAVCRDELAGWLSGFDQYKASQGADENRWLEIWNGQWLTVDRKSSDEPIRIRWPSVSVAGTIQPGVFRRVVSRDRFENGMAQRVLWAKPPLSSQVWKAQDLPAKLTRRMERLFKKLVSLEMESGNLGADPVHVPVAPEAISDWAAWYEEFDRRAAEQDELVGSAWAKLHIYAARFSLILHLVNCFTGVQTDSISAETVKTAIELAEWFAHEIRRVYTIMRTDDEDAELVKVAESVQRRGGETTVAELARSGPRCVRDDRNAAETCLDQLVEKKWGEWDEKPAGPKGGKPTRVFRLSTLDTKPQKGPKSPFVDTKPQKSSGNTGVKYPLHRKVCATTQDEIEEFII